MDVPTPAMYGLRGDERVLVVGTATPHPNAWAITVDPDPHALARVRADGRHLPFPDNVFDVVVLDFVTNFVPPPRDVPRLIREARRVGRRVMGRCHVSATGRVFTLPGPKQRFTHPEPPAGVTWVEVRRERPPTRT